MINCRGLIASHRLLRLLASGASNANVLASAFWLSIHLHLNLIAKPTTTKPYAPIFQRHLLYRSFGSCLHSTPSAWCFPSKTADLDISRKVDVSDCDRGHSNTSSSASHLHALPDRSLSKPLLQSTTVDEYDVVYQLHFTVIHLHCHMISSDRTNYLFCTILLVEVSRQCG